MRFASRRKPVLRNVPDVILGDTTDWKGRSYAQAAQYFDQGYNCAQSVLLATAEVFGLESDPATLRGAAALTGGIGYAGCTCGALVGASLCIGILTADETKPRNNKGATDLSGTFHDAFKEKFKTTCCRGLRKDKGFLNRGRDAHCREITATTAAMVVDLLAVTASCR